MNQRHAAVDIVVATRNRPRLVERAIASIRASAHVDLTIWVIDQSDDDQTSAVVALQMHDDPRVRYVRQAVPGLSLARNTGVAAGSAPVILFTDDDCRVGHEWVGAMLAELADPATWAAFGRVLPEYPDGLADAEPDRAYPPALGVKLATRRTVYEGNLLQLGFGHGASMGVRRECYERLGGFDELLGAGGALGAWEDRDFGYRVLAAGGRIVYTPDAVLYHLQWRNWADLWRTHTRYALGAGAAAGKYLRCGDLAGLAIFGEWLLSQGLRQSVSALLKWRSLKRLRTGLTHLVTPWEGLARGMRYPVQPSHRLYGPPCDDEHAVAPATPRGSAGWPKERR